MATSATTRCIRCQTSDEETIQVPQQMVRHSKLFENLTEDWTEQQWEDPANCIPLHSDFEAKHLQWAIEWTDLVETELNGTPSPALGALPPGLPMDKSVVTPQEYDLLKRMDGDDDFLHGMLKCAHFLDMPTMLRQLAMYTIASRIRHNPPEAIRHFFGFENDLSETESTRLRVIGESLAKPQ